MLYRAACEQLALARSRAYPVHLTSRLESLTQRAHQLIYRRTDYGAARFAQLFLLDFPQAVRAHWRYVLVAGLVFGLPLVLLGIATYLDPGFILTMHDAQTVQGYEEMYGPGAEAIGRERSADTDWMMFGFYIMNNISIAFKCFAGGIVLGLGSLFALAYNGVSAGSLAGYLTARGHAETFYSFVVTHGAFELTAIVLSGAAGLRLGHALLAPGRRTRRAALELAARESAVLIYGVFAMLLIAAGLEAFWSSARWVVPAVKFASAVCAGRSSSPISSVRAARARPSRRGPCMQIEAIAVHLRPRSMSEATDLGVRLVQANARSVWATFTPVWAVVALIALACGSIATWLPGLIIFCIKPWLDRTLLFVLSRAVFGTPTRLRDVWAAQPAVWWQQLFSTLTWRRLSPWRAFTQPARQLEGQRGAAGRARRKQLLLRQARRGVRHAAGVLARRGTVCDQRHLAVRVVCTREPSTFDVRDLIPVEQPGRLDALPRAAAYAGVVLLVEPFYVGAGFAMYLNRRVELEAWDIEQEFRLAFAE